MSNSLALNEGLLQRIKSQREVLGTPRKMLRFYIPGLIHYRTYHLAEERDVFASISITGTKCALSCDHCNAQILKNMIPATSPKRLLKVCERLAERGYVGCLISGGSTPNGSVPLTRFAKAIAKVKKELGLIVIVHTGLVDTKIAGALKEAEIDVALIDIIGSSDTIRSVCHLNASPEDYARSLALLKEAGIPIVPHIVIGLHYGKLLGEMRALEIIHQYNPKALVIIVLTPMKGTLMENVKPPIPIEVANVILEARSRFLEIPILLGCARPGGFHRIETDMLATLAGVDGIAFPSEEVIAFARRSNIQIRFSRVCCALIFKGM